MHCRYRSESDRDNHTRLEGTSISVTKDTGNILGIMAISVERNRLNMLEWCERQLLSLLSHHDGVRAKINSCCNNGIILSAYRLASRSRRTRLHIRHARHYRVEWKHEIACIIHFMAKPSVEKQKPIEPDVSDIEERPGWLT